MAVSSEPSIPVVPRIGTAMSVAAMLDKLLAKMDEQGRKMDDMISSLATTTSRLLGAAADSTPSSPSTTVGLATVSSWAVAAQPIVNTFDTDVNFATPTKCSTSCSDHDDGKQMATTTRASTSAMAAATSATVVKPRCLDVNSFGRIICKASTRRQVRGGRSFRKASTLRQVRRPLSTIRVQQLAARQVFDEIPREAEGLPAWEEGYYTTARQWQTMILGSDHVVFVELPKDNRPREWLSQEHLKAWFQPVAATSSATMGVQPCTAPMSRWCMHGPGWLAWSCGAHAAAASDIRSTLKLGSDQDIRCINDNRTLTPDWEISGIQLAFDEMPPWQRNDVSPGVFGIEKARSVCEVMPSWRLSGFSPGSQVTGYPSVLRFRVLNKAKMVVAMSIMVSNSGAAMIANFPILQVVWLLLPWPPPGRSEFAHDLMSIICLQLSRPWDPSAPSSGLKKHSAQLLLKCYCYVDSSIQQLNFVSARVFSVVLATSHLVVLIHWPSCIVGSEGGEVLHGKIVALEQKTSRQGDDANQLQWINFQFSQLGFDNISTTLFMVKFLELNRLCFNILSRNIPRMVGLLVAKRCRDMEIMVWLVGTTIVVGSFLSVLLLPDERTNATHVCLQLQLPAVVSLVMPKEYVQFIRENSRYFEAFILGGGIRAYDKMTVVLPLLGDKQILPGAVVSHIRGITRGKQQIEELKLGQGNMMLRSENNQGADDNGPSQTERDRWGSTWWSCIVTDCKLGSWTRGPQMSVGEPRHKRASACKLQDHRAKE